MSENNRVFFFTEYSDVAFIAFFINLLKYHAKSILTSLSYLALSSPLFSTSLIIKLYFKINCTDLCIVFLSLNIETKRKN